MRQDNTFIQGFQQNVQSGVLDIIVGFEKDESGSFWPSLMVSKAVECCVCCECCVCLPPRYRVIIQDQAPDADHEHAAPEVSAARKKRVFSGRPGVLTTG